MANNYRVAIITVSDKGAAGQRQDLSGPAIRELMEQAGYSIAHTAVVPDEQDQIMALLTMLADEEQAELILTTGGTGFAKRDITPEATAEVAERLAPGIGEAMRAYSLSITPRGMLSRGIAALRGNSLIVNLPGSPKAVRETLAYILPALEHGLDILTGSDSECAAARP